MFQEWLKKYEKLREENNMSEEEIIEYLKEVISWHRKNTPDRVYALNNKDIEMIQGLLDLYNKEKEKNKKIEDKIKVKLEKLKGQKGQYRLMLEQEYKGLLEE